MTIVYKTMGDKPSSMTDCPPETTRESDPHGKHPNSPGAKLDKGKVRVGLVFRGFARALWRVCEVGTYGATKYTDDGWLSVPDGEARYDDAKGRHLLKGYMEPLDPDTNIEHLAHEAWNALARLELELRKKERAQRGSAMLDTINREWPEPWTGVRNPE